MIRLNDNKGFSLVQVIISMGLLGGLILGGFKILEKQTQVGKSSSFFFEALNITDDIKSVLSAGEACTVSLRNKSAYFDDVKEIFSLGSLMDNEAEYEVSKDSLNLYGQKNIIINKIELNGNAPEIGVDNNLTIMSFFYEEVGTGDEVAKMSIPIHVELNELGRIVSCFTLPGISSQLPSQADKNSWRSEEGKESELVASQDQVIVGKVQKGNSQLSPSLSIEGALNLGIQEVCSRKSSGLLVYDISRDYLKWCNQKGKWENLSQLRPMFGSTDDIIVSNEKGIIKTELTKKDYAYCTVSEQKFSSGMCWSRPSQTENDSQKWELVAEYYRGDKLECHFKCFELSDD